MARGDDDDIRTGFAKLGRDPGEAFLQLLVDRCLELRLAGFNAQALANLINGECLEFPKVQGNGSG